MRNYGTTTSPDLGVSPFSLHISFPSALSFIVLPDMKESFPSEFCFFYTNRGTRQCQKYRTEAMTMDEQVVAVVPQSVRGSDCLGHAMPCPYPHAQSSPCRASDGQLVQTPPTSSIKRFQLSVHTKRLRECHIQLSGHLLLISRPVDCEPELKRFSFPCDEDVFCAGDR